MSDMKFRVNFSLMEHYVSFQVLFVGELVRVETSQNCVIMKSSDNVDVNVFMDNTQNLYPGYVYEIVGIVEKDDQGTLYITQNSGTVPVFFTDSPDKFDFDSYNQMVDMTARTYQNIFYVTEEQAE
ncbi:replication factor A3 [Acrasis kona]|uniref:Replication factor A3 n=1 Tax=Acrasis kona TaxID=1008807 RepID=A0AAW2Z4R2_9EUKA